MIDEVPKQILLVGLAETGKTSYLAALYNYVTSKKDDRIFTQYKLSSNDAYLNSIRTAWLRGGKFERTATVTEGLPKEVTLHLTDSLSDQKVDLYIPDIAGESFLQQFTLRQWENSYKLEAEAAIGIILFLRKEKIRPHVLLDDISKMNEIFGHEGEANNFNPEQVPTQVILNDILRTHYELMNQKKIKLSIVISAWDKLKVEKISPLKWIEVNMPLFFQYLKSNSELFDYKVFGVSAMGGEPGDNSEMIELLNLDDQTERIIVQELDQEHKNICSPIQWIID